MKAKGPCKHCQHFIRKKCIGSKEWCASFSKYTIRQLKRDKADMRRAMIEHCKRCKHFSRYGCVWGPADCQLYPYVISRLYSK